MEKNALQLAMSHSLLLERIVMVLIHSVSFTIYPLLVTAMILVWQQHQNETRPKYS